MNEVSFSNTRRLSPKEKKRKVKEREKCVDRKEMWFEVETWRWSRETLRSNVFSLFYFCSPFLLFSLIETRSISFVSEYIFYACLIFESETKNAFENIHNLWKSDFHFLFVSAEKTKKRKKEKNLNCRRRKKLNQKVFWETLMEVAW